MKSKLPLLDLAHKKVLLRADLNVPLDQNGKILDDFRLTSTLPTIDYILSKGASIILLTHLGRPKGFEPHLSTKNVIPWFEQRGYQVLFASNPAQAALLAKNLKPKTVLLLENVRFFPGEQQGSTAFAEQLAHLGDYFVNDGFGVLHRSDASVAVVPTFFSKKNKTIGFLVEKEIAALTTLRDTTAHPFICILGGGKIEDKAAFVKYLLSYADKILLAPALVFTFMKAKGMQVGHSLVDDSMVEECKSILHMRQAKKIEFPVDFLVSESSIDGPYQVVAAQDFTPNSIGIALGPKTTEQYCVLIKDAGTVLLAGAQGFLDKPKTTKPMEQLVSAMDTSDATTVIAGGDSVAIALHVNVNHIHHLSAGGGAMLNYLTKQKLPGLEALEKDKTR